MSVCVWWGCECVSVCECVSCELSFLINVFAVTFIISFDVIYYVKVLMIYLKPITYASVA